MTEHTAYSDLVNVSAFGKKREEFIMDRGDVTFHCRDCKKIVAAARLHPNKYDYECPECHGHNISIGTVAGLQDFYSRG